MKAVVLLSGGQDSTTCLYLAKAQYGSVAAISLDYGQRHAIELDAAAEIAAMAGVPHEGLSIPALQQIGGSALIGAEAPIAGSGGLADAEMPQGLPTSFVPGRNMILLATAAAYAVKAGAKTIVTGTCQTDFSGYPDCRRVFIDAMQVAATLAMPSSCGPIHIDTPLMWLTKAETVALARSLPGCWEALARSVTCYMGERPGCGACPACDLRAAGFAEAGLPDPAR